MKEGIVFVEKDFWHKLGTDRNRYVFSDRIIRSHSAVYTDFQKNDIGADPILYDIYNDIGGRFYWNKNINDYIDSDDIVALSSIYFFDKDSAFCDGKSIMRGIIALNNSQYSSRDYLFDLQVQEIDEDQKYIHGWKNQIFNHIFSEKQCNSLIINDKYLCNKGFVDPALKDILDLVLPSKTILPFHLSIFSEINANGDSIFKEIKDMVSSVRSPAFANNTMLTLCYTTLHDRFIISNTFLITVGAGFALFYRNGKPKNSTAIKLLFPTAIGKKTEYNLWIKKAKEMSNCSQNYWGEKENRLFELAEG